MASLEASSKLEMGAEDGSSLKYGCSLRSLECYEALRYTLRLEVFAV